MSAGQKKLSIRIWIRNDRNVPTVTVRPKPKQCPLSASPGRSLYDRDWGAKRTHRSAAESACIEGMLNEFSAAPTV